MSLSKDIREAARWVRIRHLSNDLEPLGAWMSSTDKPVYIHLRILQQHMKPTAEELEKYAPLRKTARKYRKLRRRTSQLLGLKNPSTYGVGIYLEYQTLKKSSSR